MGEEIEESVAFVGGGGVGLALGRADGSLLRILLVMVMVKILRSRVAVIGMMGLLECGDGRAGGKSLCLCRVFGGASSEVVPGWWL